jgi:hypothetical protein
MGKLVFVFVHGYSVTNLDTYGELPLRLRNEAQARGMEAKTEHIFLSRYISFSDEVRLNDLSKALQFAIQQQLPKEEKFICITHSTGGPLVRNWWYMFYSNETKLTCPMSHLIMLAPANHGSALAQLGKTRLSRVKSWFDGVEPGQKILDWLEHGSAESWSLNKDWIVNGDHYVMEKNFFPFVITGRDIDRRLYDHINSYTGELGSDGVVRVASANLNSSYIKLEQQTPQIVNGELVAPMLELAEFKEAPYTPMRIVRHRSHSGDKMGIMKSVKKEREDTGSNELINAIFNCLSVNTIEDYARVYETLLQETRQVQAETKVEEEVTALKKKLYIHDRYSLVMFRITDSEGYLLDNFDLILTAGPDSDPDMLPIGFFADRQCNKANRSTLTYFFNYDIMHGCDDVKSAEGDVVRKAIRGTDMLGLKINPRPEEGFIRYLPCQINASRELLEKILKPDCTTLIDICLKRVVSQEIFRFEKITSDKMPDLSFKKADPGINPIS